MTGESHIVSLPVAQRQMFASSIRVHLLPSAHHTHVYCVRVQVTLHSKAKYESFATLQCNSKQVNHNTLVYDLAIS